MTSVKHLGWCKTVDNPSPVTATSIILCEHNRWHITIYSWCLRTGSITVVIQSLRALRKSVQYLWRGNGICLYYLCSLLLHGLLCRSLKPNTGIEYHWTHVGLRPAFPQTGNRKCLCHAMCVHQRKWTSKYQLCVPQRNRLWAAWQLCLIRLRVYPWLFFFPPTWQWSYL